MTLTKAHIVKALFAQNIFTKTESAQVIDTLFELIKQSLQNGEDVLISGFGKFSVKEKHGRTGRNPKTGKPKDYGVKPTLFTTQAPFQGRIMGSNLHFSQPKLPFKHSNRFAHRYIQGLWRIMGSNPMPLT